MCGRFVSATPPDQIARYFDATPPEAALEPGYNVAPTNDVYVVLADGSTRRVTPMHWGLVPRWAKDPSIGNKMINARAETLAEKNAYRSAFAKRRCLIPADGFYEWKAVPGQKRKQPMYIHGATGEPLAFAGLWELWKDPNATEAERAEAAACCGRARSSPGARTTRWRPSTIGCPSSCPARSGRSGSTPRSATSPRSGRLLVPAPSSMLQSIRSAPR